MFPLREYLEISTEALVVCHGERKVFYWYVLGIIPNMAIHPTLHENTSTTKHALLRLLNSETHKYTHTESRTHTHIATM